MQNMYFDIVYNQSADKTHHTHPQLLFFHIKRDTDCCGFALFFRGLASCEWNGQQATGTAANECLQLE